MDLLRVERAARESELAAARSTRESRARDFRAAEQEIAGIAARLRSLEELDAARAEYGDGARLVLAESNGDVGQMGSVADYLEVDSRYERAVEAGLGDLLQHVVVRTHEEAAAGLRFAEERNAGRVGFLVVNEGAAAVAPEPREAYGAMPMASVVRVSGPAERAIATSIASAWIAESPDAARAAAAVVDGAVVTLDGVVYRGAHQVEGGARAESRGILATKREIKELRERLEAGREAVERLREEIASLDMLVAGADSAIGTVQAELHRQEKDIVGFELQVRSGARRARADRPETGADQRRAPHRRRGTARAGSPPGRGTGLDRPDRRGTARRRRSPERGAAAAVRGARCDAGAGAAHGRGEGRARGAHRAGHRARGRHQAPRGGRTRAGNAGHHAPRRAAAHRGAARAAAGGDRRPPRPRSTPTCAPSTTCARTSATPRSAAWPCAARSRSTSRASRRRAADSKRCAPRPRSSTWPAPPPNPT